MIARKVLTLFAVVSLLAGVAQLSHAHHSFAASFIKKEIVKEGVVDRYVFRNPHVIVYMMVAIQMVKKPSGWSKALLLPHSGRQGGQTKP